MKPLGGDTPDLDAKFSEFQAALDQLCQRFSLTLEAADEVVVARDVETRAPMGNFEYSGNHPYGEEA